MPSRPHIPPAGSPLAPPGQPGAFRRVLAGIADAAGRQDAMQNGLAGSEGTITAPPPQLSIGLFQLS